MNTITKPRRTTKICAISIPTDLARWVERRAMEEGRSFSNYVSMVLRNVRAAEEAAQLRDAQPEPTAA